MKDYFLYIAKYLLLTLLNLFIIYLILPKDFVYLLWPITSILLFLALSIHSANIFKLKHALQFRQLHYFEPKISIWQDVMYFLTKWQKRYRKRYEDLQNQHQDFIKAIQASPNGVILLDNQGYIKWLNSRMKYLLNISTQDKGQRLQHLVRHPDFLNYWNNPTESGIDLKILTQVLHIKILTIDENNLLFLVQDITQRHKINQLHKDFMANVSHELLTPLTSILGFSETLINKNINLNSQLKEQYLEYIHKSALHMQDLVKDLLLITELENSKTIEKKLIDIYKLIKSIFKEFELSLSGRKLILNDNISHLSDKSYNILGIEKELKCVFNNLLDNASKYTNANGIIQLNLDLISADELKISVIDNGIGIAPEHISSLTHRFYRVPESQHIHGNGLGLYIADQILKKHETKFDVSSQISQGSCFSMVFKLEN